MNTNTNHQIIRSGSDAEMPAPPREPLRPPHRPAGGWSRWVCGLALLIGLLTASAARAIEIQFIEVATSPLSKEQRDAFEEAKLLWENVLFGPAEVIKLKIRFREFPENPRALGETEVSMTTHLYKDVRDTMVALARGSELLTMKTLPMGLSVPVRDVNGLRDDDKITMTTANAKALRLGTGPAPDWGKNLPGDVDANITFNKNYPFDYNPADGIDSDKYNFVAVAAHEIGHALGFTSVTDRQEANPGTALHPTPLDLWRFEATGGAHNITTEARKIKNGKAEYSDSVGINWQFSRGFCDSEADALCGAEGCSHLNYRCQASHWRDGSREALMDPTLDFGEEKSVESDDIRAFEYIGYDSSIFYLDVNYYIPPWHCLWWKPDCGGCPPPDPFLGYPGLPVVPEPPFAADLGVVMGLDFGVLGGVQDGRRSGLGFAQFRDAIPGPFPVLQGLPYVDGVQNLLPPREPMDVLPPAIMNFYFVSDTVAGVPFTARSLLSETGAQYDSTLGQFGGYRICLAIDGEADGVEGDIDGLVTVELLADAGGVPNPVLQNVFQSVVKPGNSFTLLDPEALGFSDPRNLRAETETNNMPETANPLGSVRLATVLGTITPGDVDYYSFTAPTNSRVWITVDTGGPQGAEANSRDSFVTLYGADGVTVIEDDDDDGSGNGGDGTLESDFASAIAGRTLAAGGTYYAAVRAYDAGQIIAPYRLLLTVTSSAYDPEVESNDQDFLADPIVSPAKLSGVRSGLISGPNDLDYFSVTVTGRSLLHVSADGDPSRSGFGTDTIADLIAPDGVTSLFTANSSTAGAPGNPPAEGFCYVVPSAGTYFVRVRGVEQTQGPYHLMVASCPTGQPRLTTKNSGPNVLVTWPADAYGYRLQSSGDLQSWGDVTVVPSLSGSSLGVTVPSDSGNRFFRLISLP